MRLIPLTLALLLAPSRAGPPAPTPCTLTASPDRVSGLAYHVRLRVSPGCPATATFRVRKSSTLNVKGRGAPYQPIRPDGSEAAGGLFAWTVTKVGSNIPPAELWTSLTWEWQRYDPDRPDPRTGRPGLWERIPQWVRP